MYYVLGTVLSSKASKTLYVKVFRVYLVKSSRDLSVVNTQ